MLIEDLSWSARCRVLFDTAQDASWINMYQFEILLLLKIIVDSHLSLLFPRIYVTHICEFFNIWDTIDVVFFLFTSWLNIHNVITILTFHSFFVLILFFYLIKSIGIIINFAIRFLKTYLNLLDQLHIFLHRRHLILISGLSWFLPQVITFSLVLRLKLGHFLITPGLILIFEGFLVLRHASATSDECSWFNLRGQSTRSI